MVNKKGIMRIVEASIAILIVFAVLLYVSQRTKTSAESDLSGKITPLLDEIAKNNTLRTMIIEDSDRTASENAVLQFLLLRIKSTRIGYNVTICEYDQICSLKSYPADASGDVYSVGRTITAAISKLAPKKVQISMWIRK